jgi:hypothetical protein
MTQVLELDAPLTFREFMTQEDLPLATIFREIFTFLSGRSDAVLFGAQAVNAYSETERMTHDVDVLSTDAATLAESIRAHLAERFHIAVRVQAVASQSGYRVYQVRSPKNRHLVDVRSTDTLPQWRQIGGIRVIDPVDLMALKVVSVVARHGRPKADTDRADLRRLLLAFPFLKKRGGEIEARLHDSMAPDAALAFWHALVEEPIEPDDED